jgi:ectoine hydroxylase-related dioxygenase (phytanoyl-CoA dioxygenase family)
VTTGECRLDALDPVIDLSPAAAAIATSPAIHALLVQLLGEPAVLFKDKLIYKLGGAPGYPLHQDFIAWDEFPRSFTTVVVALDPATRDNGATEVFLGQHHGGALAPEDGGFHRLNDDVIDASRALLLELSPGDVAVFGGFLPHRSGTNTTSSSRRLLYLSYQRESEGGDQRASHYAQFHAWLRERYAEHGRHDTWFR